MGGRASKHHDLLESSEWLRSVVSHHQKGHHGVSSFSSFTIEPAVGGGGVDDDSSSRSFQEGGVRLNRVAVAFRDGKDQHQEVMWIVKSAYGEAAQNLSHEIKVCVSLLPEVRKFLATFQQQQQRFLLNIPDYVHHERKCESRGSLCRCLLVLEDIGRTKVCLPLEMSRVEAGLGSSQFKVFVGTLAQFHAVGLAYDISQQRDDSLLGTFPFLLRNQRAAATLVEVRERELLLGMYEKLLKWQLRTRRKNRSSSNEEDEDFRRRLRLTGMLRARAGDLLEEENPRRDPLRGLCLGPVLPAEVMFQYEDKDKRNPTCAAVITCHRVHYGNILRELSLSFFCLANADVRNKVNMVSVLQTYCHVLTSTLEVLDVDWARQYRLTFQQFVERFQSFAAQALLRAIVIHMRLTDSRELERLSTAHQGGGGAAAKAKNNGRRNELTLTEESECKVYIPLTERRLEFLVRLTDALHKPV